MQIARCLNTRNRPRFFDQVGHQTTYAYIGNKHFFTKSCHRQTYQNYEQPSERLQNLYFQSHFSASKINGIFLIFFSVKNIRLGDRLLYLNFFENFDFLSTLVFSKCAQFLSALFIILVVLPMTLFSEKMLISHRCIHVLMPNLIKKSWTVSTKDV